MRKGYKILQSDRYSGRFTQEQITFALRQAESGLPVEDVCRKLGICQATFFRWKTKYGAMGNEEIRRLRILEEENRKSKQLVADQSLDKKLLQDVLSKKLQSHPCGTQWWLST